MQHNTIVCTLRNPGFCFVRLVEASLPERVDEWTVAEHRYFGAEPMARLTAPPKTASTHELLIAIA